MSLQLICGVTWYIMQNKIYSYIYNNCIYYINAHIDDIDNKIDKVLKENIKLNEELKNIKQNIKVVLIDIDTLNKL